MKQAKNSSREKSARLRRGVAAHEVYIIAIYFSLTLYKFYKFVFDFETLFNLSFSSIVVT